MASADPAEVRITDSLDESAWDNYVQLHPQASVYHTTAWHRAVRDTFGKETTCLTALDSRDKPIGVLPLIRQKGIVLGDRLVSLPYCNYGGPLVSAPNIAAQLMQSAIDTGARLGVKCVEFRNFLDYGEAAAADSSGEKVTMLLELPESSDELGKALGSKRRSQIRRSQKSDPRVVHGGAELLRDFYSVFCQNMRDLGTPVYPIRFFENVQKHLGERVTVTVIYIGGRPAAAAFLITYRDTVEIPWASSLREFNAIAVNMLLYWEVLKLSIENRRKVFDFGRCTRNEGTYRFKKQWGAVEWPLYWNTHSFASGDSSAASGNHRLRNLVAGVWRRLPLPVANLLGPRITANLPW